MAILSKVFSCLAIILATVLFAGAFDVFHFGLHHMLEPFAIGPIVLFMIFSIVPVFVGGKSKGGEEMDEEGLSAKIEDVRAKTASHIASLQSTLDSMTGQDKEALVEENKALKEELEAIHQAARDKASNEAEELRDKNAELEKQIKQWAIKTVGDNVPGDAAGQQNAA